MKKTPEKGVFMLISTITNLKVSYITNNKTLRHSD